MDPALLATALGDGRDADVLLEFGGVVEMVALLAEGGQQAGREDLVLMTPVRADLSVCGW